MPAEFPAKLKSSPDSSSVKDFIGISPPVSIAKRDWPPGRISTFI